MLDEANSRKFYWYAIACLAIATVCAVVYYFTKIAYLNVIGISGAVGYIVLGMLSKPKYKRIAAKKFLVPYLASRLVILAIIVAVIAYAFIEA